MNPMKRIAIIPARSGSKGLEDKNILTLGGIPLMSHTILAAYKSRLFTRVIVSTDSVRYAQIAQMWGAEVRMRSPELATDRSTTYQVVKDVLDHLDDTLDEIVVLQPTSPLRTAQHIREAVELFEMYMSRIDFLVSVKEADHPQSLVQPLDEHSGLSHFMSDFTNYHRQDEHDYSPNGAIFIGKPEEYLKQGHFFGPRSLGYRMSQEASIDIDSVTDLIEAEAILRSNPFHEVAVLGTTYSLFFFLLLRGEEGLSHTFFVLTDGVPEALRLKLPHVTVSNHYGTHKALKSFYRLMDYVRLRHYHRQYNLFGLPIWGHDHLPASLYYLNCRRELFHLVEDGTHNYVDMPIRLNPHLRWLYRLLPIGPVYQPFGHSERVEHVYLTGMAPIPQDLQAKAEVHDLAALWQATTPEYRLRLIHLFDIPQLPADTSRYHLVITQPLSEDGHCTEAEKVEAYRRAVADLRECTLLIKPHPRELTDYTRVFPQATVMHSHFPVEVFLLLHPGRILDIYTVDSSCIDFIRRHVEVPIHELSIQSF
jgi:N-acylneuraminate cytidylyltransferase